MYEWIRAERLFPSEMCSGRVEEIGSGEVLGVRGRMAEIYPEVVEKVVILSCAVASTEDLKVERVKKVEGDVCEFFVPKTDRKFDKKKEEQNEPKRK